MCEREIIRFAYEMQYENVENNLVVGVVCDGHISGDQEATVSRDQYIKNIFFKM